MKLKSLSLGNFRQFYGEQEITFSADEKQNVTIVHGENGSGKTALLNAFKWCLYGEHDFESGDEKQMLCQRLASESGVLDQELKCWVTLTFDHEGSLYQANREAGFKRIAGTGVEAVGRPRFSLSVFDRTGGYRAVVNPQEQVDQILPRRMHPYFFFNGERIEKLASIGSTKDVQEAVKGIMGLEIFERAISHLWKGVMKRQSKQLRESSDGDLRTHRDDEASTLENLEFQNEAAEQYRANINSQRGILDDCNSKLKKLGPVAKFQEDKETIEREIEEQLKPELENLRKDRKSWLSKKAFLVFSPSITGSARTFLEERRSKGELPSGIKTNFLEDLIERRECICGRSLEPGEHATQCVENRMSVSVSQDIEDRYHEVSGLIRSLAEEESNFRVSLVEIDEAIYNAEEKLNQRFEEIDRLTGLIRGSANIDAQTESARADGARQEIERQTLKLGGAMEQIKLLDQQLKDTQEKIRKIEAQDRKNEQLVKRINATKDTHKAISDLYQVLANTVRTELSQIVDQTFQKIMKKNYWTRVENDYSLRVYKELNGQELEVYDKSTGEAQITSLSFIGGLVKLAKHRHSERGDAGYYKGGLYPIVMDSPYGNLDPEYKEKVASALPELADQIIVFVSNSQWRGEVQEAVRYKVGAEYTLVYHTPQKKEGTKTSSIIQGAETEYTEIREGYYE